MFEIIKKIFKFNDKEMKSKCKLLEFDEFLFKNQIILIYDDFGLIDYSIIRIYCHKNFMELNSAIMKNWRNASYSWIYSSETGLEEIWQSEEELVFSITWIVDFLNANPSILYEYKKYKRNESKNFDDVIELKTGATSDVYFREKILFEGIANSISYYLRYNKNAIAEFLFNNKIKKEDFEMAMFRYMEKIKY